MLSGKLSLHGVKDVEAFCARIVQRANLELCWADQEDLLAYIIETCWELSEVYVPGGPKQFDGWASRILTLRVVDWQRSRFGRSRYRFGANPSWNQDRDRPIFTELGDAFSERAVDTAPDRSPDLMRVLGEGNSAQPRQVDGMGEAPAREAA